MRSTFYFNPYTSDPSATDTCSSYPSAADACTANTCAAYACAAYASSANSYSAYTSATYARSSYIGAYNPYPAMHRSSMPKWDSAMSWRRRRMCRRVRKNLYSKCDGDTNADQHPSSAMYGASM